MAEAARDAELFDRLRRGEDAAFRDVVARFGPYLFGIARTLCRDNGEAEDAVQETLAAMLSFRPRGEASVKTVLVSILVRQAALLRRKRRGWLRLVRPDDEDIPGRPDRAGPIAAADDATEARMDLPVLLADLPAEFREVIVLRELQGMSYDAIAEVLDVPRGTVESRLHRARERLRQRAAADRK
ncbi:MAG TPA: RNA polymerase sigma factor [Tepidisphaeraceae bacterium]|jgi:RNA polymerase sigma-70 factor (ECF subfamily)